MSIVVSLKQKNFAGVACDGRLSRRRADGGLVAITEDHYKFRVLMPDIVLAATGSEFIELHLSRSAEDFVQKRLDDENLFQELAALLPLQLRALHAQAKRHFGTGYEGTIGMLLGFDAAERRIRRMVWQARGEELDYWEDDEATSSMGNEDATPLGLGLMEQAARDLGPNAPPDRVLPALELVVGRVSDAVPHSVNRNVRSYLIVPDAGDALLDGTTYGRPLSTRISAGKPLIDFSEAIHLNKNLDNVADGTRAAWDSVTMKTSAVDTSGNLLLKNILQPTPTTTDPTISSTTPAVIAEMTQSITSKGNVLLLLFSGTFAVSSFGVSLAQVILKLQFYRGGVAKGDVYEISWKTDTLIIPLTATLCLFDQPAAGTYTYDVRWSLVSAAGVPVVQSSGTSRRFQIVELG